MKAIIAKYFPFLGIEPIGSRVNHLWLVEGWMPPSRLDDGPKYGRDSPNIISDSGDRRVVLTLCGTYRKKEGWAMGKRYNLPEAHITIVWLYTKEGAVCKRCQAIAKRKGLGMGYYNP
jgi:hypothetical protein